MFPTNDAEAPVSDGIVEVSTTLAICIDKQTGEKLDENITLNPEEAGDNLVAYEQNLAAYIEGSDLSTLVDVVDAARAELLKAAPKLRTSTASTRSKLRPTQSSQKSRSRKPTSSSPRFRVLIPRSPVRSTIRRSGNSSKTTWRRPRRPSSNI